MKKTCLTAIAAVAALGITANAFGTRVLEQIEGAYEASLADVVMPASAAGYVIFPTCSTCGRISLGVTSETTYLIERAPVPLADFLEAADAFAQSSRASRAAVYVFYDLETKRVTRLVLDELDDA